MNPETAAERGIVDGQKVRVFNKSGEIVPDQWGFLRGIHSNKYFGTAAMQNFQCVG